MAQRLLEFDARTHEDAPGHIAFDLSCQLGDSVLVGH